MTILALHKPYGYLSQFTAEPNSQFLPLSALGLPKDIWPVGRLDADSEGLLILASDAGRLKKIVEPQFAHPREYWVQVEGAIHDEAIQKLESGVVIQGRPTRPATCKKMTAPEIDERDPPIRQRKNIPTSWISLEITEGKNRQVRRMTAAVGFPTLRLLRARIGNFLLVGIPRGEWRELSENELQELLS